MWYIRIILHNRHEPICLGQWSVVRWKRVFEHSFSFFSQMNTKNEQSFLSEYISRPVQCPMSIRFVKTLASGPRSVRVRSLRSFSHALFKHMDVSKSFLYFHFSLCQADSLFSWFELLQLFHFMYSSNSRLELERSEVADLFYKMRPRSSHVDGHDIRSGQVIQPLL